MRPIVCSDTSRRLGSWSPGASPAHSSDSATLLWSPSVPRKRPQPAEQRWKNSPTNPEKQWRIERAEEAIASDPFRPWDDPSFLGRSTAGCRGAREPAGTEHRRLEPFLMLFLWGGLFSRLGRFRLLRLRLLRLRLLRLRLGRFRLLRLRLPCCRLLRRSFRVGLFFQFGLFLGCF